jgi:sporulation related protein
MRAFFLLLVLANLVFFAYAQVTRENSRTDKELLQLQIAPEKIKLLNAEGKLPPPEKPSKAPRKGKAPPAAKTATVAPAACLEWGIFAGPGVAKAEAALAQLELPAAQIERTVTDASGYWVHMPPQKTKAEADRKVRELNKLGVTELVMVTEPAEWRYAISLGIFRTDEAAQAFLAGLRKQGVRSAVVARRENFLKQVVFYLREPSAATAARLALMQAEFPGSEIKAGPCPRPAAGA